MLHSRIDEIERRFTDRGQTPRGIARSLRLPQPEVRAALLAVGLEVDGEVKPGYERSGVARCTSEAAVVASNYLGRR